MENSVWEEKLMPFPTSILILFSLSLQTWKIQVIQMDKHKSLDRLKCLLTPAVKCCQWSCDLVLTHAFSLLSVMQLLWSNICKYIGFGTGPQLQSLNAENTHTKRPRGIVTYNISHETASRFRIWFYTVSALHENRKWKIWEDKNFSK